MTAATDLNMHMTVANMFNLMTKHATYLRDIIYDIPAAMQQLNSTYLNNIYPYNPDSLLTRLINTPINGEEKKEQLEDLIRCSDDVLLVLRDIIGYQMTTTILVAHTWEKNFEVDLSTPAKFLQLINPDLRDQQYAANLSNPTHMKPDEWIWLGVRRLNKALRAYLLFVGEDVTKFDASLVNRRKRTSWRARLLLQVKAHLKKKPQQT